MADFSATLAQARRLADTVTADITDAEVTRLADEFAALGYNKSHAVFYILMWRKDLCRQADAIPGSVTTS